MRQAARPGLVPAGPRTDGSRAALQAAQALSEGAGPLLSAAGERSPARRRGRLAQNAAAGGHQRQAVRQPVPGLQANPARKILPPFAAGARTAQAGAAAVHDDGGAAIPEHQPAKLLSAASRLLAGLPPAVRAGAAARLAGQVAGRRRHAGRHLPPAASARSDRHQPAVPRRPAIGQATGLRPGATGDAVAAGGPDGGPPGLCAGPGRGCPAALSAGQAIAVPARRLPARTGRRAGRDETQPGTTAQDRGGRRLSGAERRSPAAEPSGRGMAAPAPTQACPGIGRDGGGDHRRRGRHLAPRQRRQLAARRRRPRREQRPPAPAARLLPADCRQPERIWLPAARPASRAALARRRGAVAGPARPAGRVVSVRSALGIDAALRQGSGMRRRDAGPAAAAGEGHAQHHPQRRQFPTGLAAARQREPAGAAAVARPSLQPVARVQAEGRKRRATGPRFQAASAIPPFPADGIPPQRAILTWRKRRAFSVTLPSL
ncbi:conserved hypothetical protein [Chromobacterium violaceum ATCC 12472]|uniref:Uncharacterized protein n=1 Tax=Chromobacterium violaceum (strain ATCC 12472 / DSM 30191 / JCM 1249 / CCUG 213 / NBRC 12614 / NCIMB 9131 / NCTC 9757 / MK) TaxID=243365 RepID=Q7NQC9_CHRVO|nr:conserved hypothetical protein [Chromobacterium violaceum ATCC 12472]